jgi:hypothetical protein
MEIRVRLFSYLDISHTFQQEQLDDDDDDVTNMDRMHSARQSAGHESNMYDDQPYQDDYHRGSGSQGYSYQNSRKGKSIVGDGT